jgi:hypothetical protein
MTLPIYGARIQLIVTHDIALERKAQDHLFGPLCGTDYDALCSRSGGHNFAVFFEPQALTHRTIAHELFHLTHRILEWVGVPFSPDNHEVFACVAGELLTWVCSHVGHMINSNKPESTESCQRCGCKNLTWFTTNALWNLVRDRCEFSILCPQCFTALASENGVESTGWKLIPENAQLDPLKLK